LSDPSQPPHAEKVSLLKYMIPVDKSRDTLTQ
jgi:hypothetical protein